MDMFKPAREGQALPDGDLPEVDGGSRTWRPGGPSCLGEREGLDFDSVFKMVRTWPVGVRKARHSMSGSCIDGSSLVNPVRVLLHVLRQVSLLQSNW